MKTPSGFVARCQCGEIVGALDYNRMEVKDAGKILGRWLMSGCSVEPRFGDSWAVKMGECICKPEEGR